MNALSGALNMIGNFVMVIAQRTIKFPHRRSIGTLYVAPKEQPEEWELLSQVRGLIIAPENQPINWQWLEEARGTVQIPAGTKVKLKITTRGASFAALEALDSDDLHALDLSHCQITDASLVHLSKFSGLKVLELTSTNIGDDGLEAIGGLLGLESLGLSHSRITTRGLNNLKQLKLLREIWLSGTAVDDLGLKCFEKLNLLVQLGLSSTRITDAGLDYLAHLKNLLRVYLFNTRVSHNGSQSLKRLLPACKVKWHPPKIHTQDAHDAGYDVPAKMTGQDDSLNLQMCTATPSPISENQFWKIIESLDWSKTGDDIKVIEPAVKTIAKMSIEEICGFAQMLAEKLYALDGESYACHIGSDAYNGVKGDFSKNWFLYVRCCVVANGKEFYERVLASPQEMPKDMEFQALLGIPSKAFKRKTGQRFTYSTKYNYETFSNKQLWGPS